MLLTSLNPAAVAAGHHLEDAVRIDGAVLSRSDLVGAATSVAERVAGASLVAVLARPTAKTVLAIAGCLIAGVPVVPVPADVGAAERRHMITDSGAQAWLGETPDEAEGLPVIPVRLHARSWHRYAEPSPDSTALIMYTSGTTGYPKGAVLTHVNIMGQAMTNLFTIAPDINNDVGFIGVPFFHIAGIGNMIGGLLLGLPTVIYPLGAFDPGALLDVLAAEGVSSIFLVPAQWQAVCAAQQAKPRDVKLRVLSWGAAPASDTLLREMASTFPGTQIFAAFGQTEMSPVTCMLLSQDALRKLGSVGRVIPTVAARVVDDNMNDVPVGEVGEIVYRAPTLMAGYWNNPKATAEAFAGGWFHSGDLVRQDEEGYIWVVDRKKDMIISGGENIYCAEVENILAAHPSITEVAVIGRPHEKWGEVPVAVVAVTANVNAELESALTLADLDDFLTERLARYKHPKALEIVDALPRNPSGKVLKTELRERFGDTSVS